MRVVSVLVGAPRQIEFGGRSALSAIYKTPVAGRVKVGALGLEGDSQAGAGHGGPFQAVYAYSLGGYEFWKDELGRETLDEGAFGENLTIEGLIDADVRSGDVLRVGDVELMVTTPRIPCFKLEIRLEALDVIQRFLACDWPGIYMKVLKEGTIGAGDSVEFLHRQVDSLSVVELVRLYDGTDQDSTRLVRAANLESIPEGWKTRLANTLQRAVQSAT